jgi:hypothetical protein
MPTIINFVKKRKKRKINKTPALENALKKRTCTKLVVEPLKNLIQLRKLVKLD